MTSLSPVLELAGSFCHQYYSILVDADYASLQDYYSSEAALSRVGSNGLVAETRDVASEVQRTHQKVKGLSANFVSLDAQQIHNNIVVSLVVEFKKISTTYIHTLILEGSQDEDGLSVWHIVGDILRDLPAPAAVTATAAPTAAQNHHQAPAKHTHKHPAKTTAAPAPAQEAPVPVQEAPAPVAAAPTHPKQPKHPKEHTEKQPKKAASPSAVAPVKTSWAGVAASGNASTPAPAAPSKPAASTPATTSAPQIATTQATPSNHTGESEEVPQAGMFIKFNGSREEVQQVLNSLKITTIKSIDFYSPASAAVYFNEDTDAAASLEKFKASGASIGTNKITFEVLKPKTKKGPRQMGKNRLPAKKTSQA